MANWYSVFNYRIKFSIIGRKWKTISISDKKKQHLIRFYSYYPFIRIDTLHSGN